MEEDSGTPTLTLYTLIRSAWGVGALIIWFSYIVLPALDAPGWISFIALITLGYTSLLGLECLLPLVKK